MGGMFSSQSAAPTSGTVGNTAASGTSSGTVGNTAASGTSSGAYKYNNYRDFQSLNANAITNLPPDQVNPNLTKSPGVRLSPEQSAAVSDLKDKVYDYTQIPKDFGGGKRRRKSRKIRRRKSRKVNKK